jgi:hypothetical protein
MQSLPTRGLCVQTSNYGNDRRAGDNEDAGHMREQAVARRRVEERAAFTRRRASEESERWRGEDTSRSKQQASEERETGEEVRIQGRKEEEELP